MQRFLHRSTVLAVLAAATVPMLNWPAAAAAAPVTFTSTVVNRASSQCANVPNGAPTNVLQLVQAACNGATSQNFTFVPGGQHHRHLHRQHAHRGLAAST